MTVSRKHIEYIEPEAIDGHDADVVIVATGGVPDIDWIDGAEHCTSVWDVLTGAARPSERVIERAIQLQDTRGQRPNHPSTMVALLVYAPKCPALRIVRVNSAVKQTTVCTPLRARGRRG